MSVHSDSIKPVLDGVIVMARWGGSGKRIVLALKELKWMRIKKKKLMESHFREWETVRRGMSHSNAE